MTNSGPLILLAITFALLLTGQVLITLVYGRPKNTQANKHIDTQPIIISNQSSEITP